MIVSTVPRWRGVLTFWRLFRDGLSCGVYRRMKKSKDLFKCSATSRHHTKVLVIGVMLYHGLLIMANGCRISVNELSIISLALGNDVTLARRLTMTFFPMNCLLIPFFSITVNTCFSSSAKITRKLSQSAAKLSMHCSSREFFLPWVNFWRMISTPAQSFGSREGECGHPMKTKPAILRITCR